MYCNKRFLLVAGGGTLGTYTAEELLRLGAYVDVICPEEKASTHERLHFIRGLGTEELLRALFAETRYDGIVNFIHYTDPEEYKKIHPLLMENTDHLIFLSSYRVYADLQHPITESAPRLHEVITDLDLLENDTYAVRKCLCEDWLWNEHKRDRFTIVRPVISFSHRRFDLLMNGGRQILDCAEQGEPLLLPLSLREHGAGIDWAGNSGKLIANLLLKEDAIGEAFTICSGHGMTWGEVAEAYAAETGVQILWVDDESYVESVPSFRTYSGARHMWLYDRKYSRDIDATKVLRVTGLSREDFKSVREGIRHELDIIGWKKRVDL